MAGHFSVLLGATDAADVTVTRSSGPERPYAINIQTWPTDAPIYLSPAPADVVIAGLFQLRIEDDALAAGELLDRLVQAWSER